MRQFPLSQGEKDQYLEILNISPKVFFFFNVPVNVGVRTWNWSTQLQSSCSRSLQHVAELDRNNQNRKQTPMPWVEEQSLQ